jgi:hypothetical protein
MNERERIRYFSKVLLGNSYRLEVSALIARSKDGVVYVRQIAHELGVADSVVQPIMKQLAEAGLLSPMPRVRGHQMQEYLRRDSIYWYMCSKLIDEISIRAFREKR